MKLKTPTALRGTQSNGMPLFLGLWALRAQQVGHMTLSGSLCLPVRHYHHVIEVCLYKNSDSVFKQNQCATRKTYTQQ